MQKIKWIYFHYVISKEVIVNCFLFCVIFVAMTALNSYVSNLFITKNVNPLCCPTVDLTGQKFTIEYDALLAALVRDKTIIPLEIVYDQVWVSLLHERKILNNLSVDLFCEFVKHAEMIHLKYKGEWQLTLEQNSWTNVHSSCKVSTNGSNYGMNLIQTLN